MPIGRGINSEQNQELVEKVTEYAKKIFTKNEKLLCAVVQQKPIFNVLPRSIIVTNKRVIRFTPKVFSEAFEDFLWKELKRVHLVEKMLGCKIVFEFEKEVITLKNLPKNQAKKLYTIAQEKEEEWIEKKRIRGLEGDRASAGGSQISVNTAEGSNTKSKLLELKNLLEDDLITQDEYHKKKDVILKQF